MGPSQGGSSGLTAGQQQGLSQLMAQLASQSSMPAQTLPGPGYNIDQGFVNPNPRQPQPGQPIGYTGRVYNPGFGTDNFNPAPAAGPVRPRITAENWAGQPLEAQRVRDRRHQAGKVWDPFAGRFGTGKLVAGDPTINEFGEKYAPTFIGNRQTAESDPNEEYGTWNSRRSLYTPTPGRYISDAGDAQALGYKWPGGYGDEAEAAPLRRSQNVTQETRTPGSLW